jgi:uncharacterized repeat protein (TIGR01451 family)
MKILYQTAVVFLALFLAAPAAMGQQGSLELTSAILREVEVENEKGEKVIDLVPVQKAMPGEELVVRVTYTNQGSEPAENIVIVNPVPDQMSYVAESASGDFVLPTFSIDSGASFDLPENLVIRDEAGNEKQASPKQYTHVRFTRIKALAPGESDEVSFRAVLE